MIKKRSAKWTLINAISNKCEVPSVYSNSLGATYLPVINISRKDENSNKNIVIDLHAFLSWSELTCGAKQFERTKNTLLKKIIDQKRRLLWKSVRSVFWGQQTQRLVLSEEGGSKWDLDNWRCWSVVSVLFNLVSFSLRYIFKSFYKSLKFTNVKIFKADLKTHKQKITWKYKFYTFWIVSYFLPKNRGRQGNPLVYWWILRVTCDPSHVPPSWVRILAPLEA